MTKNVGWWSGLLVIGFISVLGCDQLERKPRPQAAKPPVIETPENNWNKLEKMPAGEIVRLALGYDHSCALYKEGNVACWGSNVSGEIGAKPEEKKYSYEPVEIKSKSFVKIAAGDHVTCGIEKDTTEMYCWGDNTQGQLGLDGNGDSNHEPVKIKRTADTVLNNVTDIYATDNAICAKVKDEGPLCWGTITYVRTEKKDGKDDRVISQLNREKTPTPLNTWPGDLDYGPSWMGNSTTDIAILKNDVCTIIKNHIRCLKAKLDIEAAPGLSGKGMTLFYSPPPKEDGFELTQLDPATAKTVTVTGLPAIATSVTSGAKFACANYGDAGGFCWTIGAEGGNEYGQLGFSGGAESLTPYALPSSKIKLLSSGARHSCAVEQDNTTYCWGGNDQGQSGAKPRWRPEESKKPEVKTPEAKPEPAMPPMEVETV